MSSPRLAEILGRISEIIGSEKDADIARTLDMARSSLATSKKRDNIPYKKIVDYCLENDVSIDHVLAGRFRKSERVYSSPSDALEAVLEVQSQLNLVFSAEQIKALLEYAYKSQADREELVSFVEAAFTIANRDLPVSGADGD